MTREFSHKVQRFYKNFLPARFSRKEAVQDFGKRYLLKPRTTDKYLSILVKSKMLFRHNGYYIKPKDWESKVTI